MRVIKFIFGSVLLIAILAGIVFLIFREVTLFSASSQIKGALKALRKIERDPTDYYYQCRSKGGDESEAVPEIFQLKFTSDTDYRLEVICRQFPLDPIVVDERKLPMMVKKIKGSSGIIWGKAVSALGLELWGRKTLVEVKDEKVSTADYRSDLGSIPVTSCSGFGFKCCQEEVSLGVGSQLFAANDCPRSCYDNCQSRPVILSFTSDPFYETKTKVVSIKRGSDINFSYVIDPGDEELKIATISYGDGEEYDFLDSKGRVSHKYNCSKSVCDYEASISATDVKNVNSVLTGVAKIKIRVE